MFNSVVPGEDQTEFEISSVSRFLAITLDFDLLNPFSITSKDHLNVANYFKST